MGYLNPAWSRCVIRFREVQEYIDKSATLAPFDDSRYRAELYGTWVLTAYAACEYSLNEIGKACVEFIGSRASTPSKLPEEVQRNHFRLTLEAVRYSLASNDPLVDVDSVLQKIRSAQWAACSSLMKIDGNVWPHVVREWLSRLGLTKSDLIWMEQAAPRKTDTYSSRMAALVAERNPIAHGVAPTQIQSSSEMEDWVQDCQFFVEKCVMSIAEKFVVVYQPRLLKVGCVDKQTQLGPNTLALSSCAQSVEVGDHVILKSASPSPVKAARIVSLMSNGSSLNSALRGARQVAVGLSKSHGGANLYMTP